MSARLQYISLSSSALEPWCLALNEHRTSASSKLTWQVAYAERLHDTGDVSGLPTCRMYINSNMQVLAARY